ncbi:hypothetical protein A0J61_02569 [Choanephora cucurbitarum]|uniref:Uncharacterized protein n=1 Tax=Choanephora cucurbitarum TaxID=101091 RepID=A0A1C7NJS2_9FUNG|nr:hypothetical protein A0J61_02569 [Choanephora cucurbitarum]
MLLEISDFRDLSQNCFVRQGTVFDKSGRELGSSVCIKQQTFEQSTLTIVSLQDLMDAVVLHVDYIIIDIKAHFIQLGIIKLASAFAFPAIERMSRCSNINGIIFVSTVYHVAQARKEKSIACIEASWIRE